MKVDYFTEFDSDMDKICFVSTWPEIPSRTLMFMLEAMTFRAYLKLDPKDADASNVIVQVWTNIYHRKNPEGIWHAIDLNFKEIDDNLHVYENSVILSSWGEYRFTFRSKLEAFGKSDSWIWKGGWMEDGIIKVNPPSNDKWTKGPEFNHIIGGVNLGNFMAASIADKLGFNAVLNVADNLDLIPSKFEKPVIYKKIPMADGAGNEIPMDKIREAVEWLTQQDATGRKILVNCRAGIGRAGSTVVAYVFKCKSSFSYDEAYNFVFSKRFVYPHRGLKDTLYKLYPRQT